MSCPVVEACGCSAVPVTAGLGGAAMFARHSATDVDPCVLCLICLFPVLLKRATTNFNRRGEGKGVIYGPPKTPTVRGGFEERGMALVSDGLNRT